MRTHDLTSRYWGHDYCIMDVFDGGKRLKMSGWALGLKRGDFLILENKDARDGANPTTRYKIDSIRYCADPRDMWFADVSFAPREQAELSHEAAAQAG